MQPTKSNTTIKRMRRAWQPPALVELPIGSETRSAIDDQKDADGRTSGSSRIASAHPAPPAAPAAKFGFSMEWAFPLSARWEK